jgi:hypothetical protein
MNGFDQAPPHVPQQKNHLANKEGSDPEMEPDKFRAPSSVERIPLAQKLKRSTGTVGSMDLHELRNVGFWKSLAPHKIGNL